MTPATEEFIKNFHNLSGVTIGEKRKNLFHLINSFKSKSKELDFSLLQPRNFLEEKLKTDVLLYFKRIPELIEVVKSEKSILIRRVLKEWFIQEVLCYMNADELVSNLFPYIAFSTKVKIINKLAIYLNNFVAADEFFKAIDNKYGLYLASKLLPSCRIDFIINFLKSHHANLTSKQLLTVIKRYPHKTEEVIDVVLGKTDGETEQYQNIFVYVGRRDVNLFVKLQKKYDVCGRLGWRVTGKYVRLHKNQVIASPGDYYRILHNRQIAKTLHHNFAPLYFNMFPRTLDEFDRGYYTIFSVLRQLPRKMKRIDLLTNTFQKRYGKSIWNYASYVRDLLDLLTPDQREKYVKNRPENITEEKWNCYLTADAAVPYFKKQISLSSSVRTRARLIKCLVTCCKFNMDLAALLDVCEYVVSAHRNDTVQVREDFLEHLGASFKLETLTEAHWRLIHQLLEISDVNDERFARTCEFKEAYIHHRLMCKLPINEQLTQWVQAEHKKLNIIKQNSQFEKRCLLSFAAIINELQTPDTWCVCLISALIDWNKRNEHDKISIFKLERVIKAFKQKFVDGSACHSDFHILNYCIRENKKQRKLYLDLYLSTSERYGNVQILEWLIRHDSLIIAQNVDRIVRVLLNECHGTNKSFFLAHARNLSHLNIPQKIASFHLNEFQKDSNRDAVVSMCYLLPPQQFLQIIAQYHPSNMQADPKTSDGCLLYALQEVIGDSLRLIQPPSAALEAILVFCKGDYLKLIRRGLYSVSDNVNEDRLVPFFEELLDRAVSTRKHAMHLTFRVLDKTRVYRIIKHFMEKEKNASLRKFIFKGCFNYFITNPGDFTWELLDLNLNAVDITDTEVVEILLQIEKVPQDYTVRYVLLTWDVLDKVPDPDRKRTSDKAKLLRTISKDFIPLLPSAFVDNVVNMYFFKEYSLSYFGSAVNVFVCNSILYCNGSQEQEQRLNGCFAIVKEFIIRTWRNPDSRTNSRNTASDFLKEFCVPFQKKQCFDKEIFVKLMNLWNDFMKPHEAFDEYLHLTFTYFLMDSYQAHELPGKLENLCDGLVGSYDQVVIGWLCQKINFFARYFFEGDQEVELYTFIENFVHENSSIACLLLAILLLDGTNPSDSCKIKYKTIIEKLQKVSDPVVQLYLCSHFGGNQKLCYKVI